MTSAQHPPIIPKRLSAGDEVRVIAPSTSLSFLNHQVREIADERLASMGLSLSFGEHVNECDDFDSSTIQSRVDDLHRAFLDPKVGAILSVIGGYNANQLLPYLDWHLIAANPKIFCGYSDITALSCAIHARTGLVTYSGPHYSSFGMAKHAEQTIQWFTSVMFGTDPQDIKPAPTWSDDHWFDDQENRDIRDNDGYWILSEGQAEGTLLGGNLCTLNLLQGTEFMPDLGGSIVFIEDDYESHPATFDRDLTSLIQQPGFDQVVGILIGRFQIQVEMNREKLAQIIASKRELQGIPIVANMDFGHTFPIMTLPVGGMATLDAQKGRVGLCVN